MQHHGAWFPKNQQNDNQHPQHLTIAVKSISRHIVNYYGVFVKISQKLIATLHPEKVGAM